MTLKALFGHPNNDYYLGNFDRELYEAVMLFEEYLKNTRIKFLFFRRIDSWDSPSIKNFESAFMPKALALMSAEKSEGIAMLKHVGRAIGLLNEAIGRSSEAKKGMLLRMRARVYEFQGALVRLNAVLQAQIRFLEHNKSPDAFNAHKNELSQAINKEEQILNRNAEIARLPEQASGSEARHVYARIMSEQEFEQVSQTGQLVGATLIPTFLVDSTEQQNRLLFMPEKNRNELLKRVGGTGGSSVLVIFTTDREPVARPNIRQAYEIEVKFRGPVPIKLLKIRR